MSPVPGSKRKSRFDKPPVDSNKVQEVKSVVESLSLKSDKLPNTLDTCPVGIMASVLKSDINELKNKGAFIPYTPLGIDVTPIETVVVETINEIENNRINDFYDDLDDLFNEFKNEIDNEDPKFNYSKRKQYNTHKQLKVPIKIISEEELVQNQSRFKKSDDSVKRYTDFGFEPSKYSGLGATSSGDAFESYRRNKANKYHEYMAVRGAVIKDPSCVVITSRDLCYSCNQPGHYAKDCKYGIR